MLLNFNIDQPSQAPSPRMPIGPDLECALCGCRRVSGSWLTFRSVGSLQWLWACLDCQHQLARGVDGEGALGG